MTEFEVLSAFLDGEAVEPDAVAAALRQPEGQAALVEFALLKVAVMQDRSMPRPAFVTASRQRVLRRASAWRSLGGKLRPLAAAALIVLAVAAGFWLGSRDGFRGSRALDAPPPSDLVIQFERGTDWWQLRNGEEVR